MCVHSRETFLLKEICWNIRPDKQVDRKISAFIHSYLKRLTIRMKPNNNKNNLEKATSTFTPPTEYLVPMALRHGRSRFWPGCNAAYNADICNTLNGAVTFKRILKMLPHWILKGCVRKKKGEKQTWPFSLYAFLPLCSECNYFPGPNWTAALQRKINWFHSSARVSLYLI